jgi:hypothetical protein
MEFEQLVRNYCDELAELLIEKNRKYGDAARNPRRIFSKADPLEQLKVRMDDKLSRIKNSDNLKKNDICDIAGYLILLMKNNGWDDFMSMVD